MERIGLAWDLGAGYGHVRKLTALAERLVARGHEVVFLSRNVRSFLAAWGAPRYPLLQAPHNDWFPDDGVAASYADILWNECGFHDPLQLEALLRAWRALIERLALTRLVAEASPLAIAAGAGLGLPRVALGSGFLLPPPGPPWPAFRDWERVDQARLAQRETLIAERIGHLRAALDLPPVAAWEALSADAEGVIGHALFDHYPARHGVRYFAPEPGAGDALPPELSGRPLLFAYLAATFPNTEAVIAALARRGEPALLVVPGMTSRREGQLVVSGRSVDARAALAQARVVICQGGNLLQQAVAAGRPVLALPTQAEQAIAARRLAELGAGRVLDAGGDGDALLGALAELLGEERYAAAAQRCAAQMNAARPGTGDDLAAFVLDARAGGRGPRSR